MPESRLRLTATAPLGEPAEPERKVCMAESVSIPPRSEARVVGRVATTVTGPILIDPTEELAERTPVLVARVIAYPTDNQVPLRILNPTQQPQMLYKDMTIASV